MRKLPEAESLHRMPLHDVTLYSYQLVPIHATSTMSLVQC